MLQSHNFHMLISTFKSIDEEFVEITKQTFSNHRGYGNRFQMNLIAIGFLLYAIANAIDITSYAM